MNKLIGFDKWLFVKINKDGASHFLDAIMPFFRQPLFWVPLYVYLVLFVLFNFPKKAWAWLLSLGVTVTATDMISSRFIKPAVGRIRPCNDPELAENIRLLVSYCGQNGSFTSSHAANHFGVAMFLFITMRPVWGNYCYLFFLWAAAICYAQVYVGVHFPLDIAGGMLVGCMLGWITGSIFKKRIGTLHSNIK